MAKIMEDGIEFATPYERSCYRALKDSDPDKAAKIKNAKLAKQAALAAKAAQTPAPK